MNPAVYKRPAKPATLLARRRERFESGDSAPVKRPVTVHASSECFVTPPEVAARMVDWLGDVSGLRVLEPEAGTGNLFQAVLDDYPSADITAIERDSTLYAALCNRFGRDKIISYDFLEYQPPEPFDSVIMNPPFGRGKAKKHVNHALGMLKPGGVLVALVPSTFSDGELLELLPVDTFAGIKVNTKIVTYK